MKKLFLLITITTQLAAVPAQEIYDNLISFKYPHAETVTLFDLRLIKWANNYFIKKSARMRFKDNVSLAQRAMLTAIHHYKKPGDWVRDAVYKIRAQNIIAPAALSALTEIKR